MRHHQCVMGNSSGKLARPARKQFFHVCTALFAAFVRCISGGVNCITQPVSDLATLRGSPVLLLPSAFF
eukprot:5969370-Ditylum_brightwellii.AAC.1